MLALARLRRLNGKAFGGLTLRQGGRPAQLGKGNSGSVRRVPSDCAQYAPGLRILLSRPRPATSLSGVCGAPDLAVERVLSNEAIDVFTEVRHAMEMTESRRGRTSQ